MDIEGDGRAPARGEVPDAPVDGEVHRRGPVIMRGRMMPKDTTYGNLQSLRRKSDRLASYDLASACIRLSS